MSVGESINERERGGGPKSLTDDAGGHGGDSAAKRRFQSGRRHGRGGRRSQGRKKIKLGIEVTVLALDRQ